MMSTTALKPATTPIPVQLSDNEFTAFILPHLSMPKRGPKCTLGYHRVFNRILWVLYTAEFIPLSFWYDAPLISRYSDRRHDSWLVYGLPSCSLARWSFWISRA